MKLSNRSNKAKEKFADSLFSISNTILSGVFLSVLIFPLSSFISSAFAGEGTFSFSKFYDYMSLSNVFIFIIVYFCPIGVGIYAREKAMDIHDELQKQSPNVLP